MMSINSEEGELFEDKRRDWSMHDDCEPRDVLIDSSSLFRILKNKNLQDSLLRWISEGNRRLILSPLVIAELLDHAQDELVVDQLVAVGDIWRKLRPNRCIWTLMPEDIFCIEAREKLTRTPSASIEEQGVYDRYLVNTAKAREFVEAQRKAGPREATAWKDERLGVDRKFQEKAAEYRSKGRHEFDPVGIRQSILNYNGPAVDSILSPALAELTAKSGMTIGMHDVVKAPARYPFIYTWACMAELSAWGNTVPGDDISEVAQNVRTARGDWFDNSIVASAALCETFPHPRQSAPVAVSPPQEARFNRNNGSRYQSVRNAPWS